MSAFIGLGSLVNLGTNSIFLLSAVALQNVGLIRIFIGSSQKLNVECVDLLDAVAGNALQITIHASRCTRHDAQLLLTLCPYARWFAAKTIDAEPRPSQFVADVHASDIETYRRVSPARLSRAKRLVPSQRRSAIESSS